MAPLFLFAVAAIAFGGAYVNMHNAGKLEYYAENPKDLGDNIVDSITDAYKDSPPLRKIFMTNGAINNVDCDLFCPRLQRIGRCYLDRV